MDQPADVLLLAPSSGLGGGIERYLAAVEEALRADMRTGTGTVTRLNLLEPGRPLGGRARVSLAARASAVVARRPTVVLGGHPNMLPLVASLARRPGSSGITFYYGHDIWGMSRGDRLVVRRTPWVRSVTISAFSAGALAALGVQADVVPAVVPEAVRATLLHAGERRAAAAPGPVRLLTTVRLSDWRAKGLPQLVEAVDALRAGDHAGDHSDDHAGDHSDDHAVELVVAGRGPAPDELTRLLHGRPGIELVISPDDQRLAELYAAADLTLLCTRTRLRPPLSGEGFGLVLLESQLAGTPVVAPATGGSRDAYVPDVTGWAPHDESAGALARLLSSLVRDRQTLCDAGARARQWAAATTDPAVYAERVHAVVFAGAASPPPAPPRQRRTADREPARAETTTPRTGR